MLGVFDGGLAACSAGGAARIADERAPFAPVIARLQPPEDARPGGAKDLPAVDPFSRSSDGRLTVFGSATGRGIGGCFTARD